MTHSQTVIAGAAEFLKIPTRITGNQVGLYFHIPFCSKKCPYCHFFVLPNRLDFQESFAHSLILEVKKNWELLRDKVVVSLYFGGGTPTLFSIHHFQKLFRILSSLNLADDCEITIEANPENVSKELMVQLKDLGFNRMSIGVQSLNDTSLKILGREHSAKKALDAINNAYHAGFTNISIDLMYDLPNQISWNGTLKKLPDLPIAHVSLYNLTIEPHTLFYKKKKTLLLPSESMSLSLHLEALQKLEDAGFTRYEISAFAKNNCYSKHNTGYWLGRPFLGFGPSAFSYWKEKRFRNIANLKKYSEEIEKGNAPIDFSEELDPIAKQSELFAIQIRLLQGIDQKDFEKNWGILSPQLLQSITNLEKNGYLKRESGICQLTKKGLLFYDTVAEELIQLPKE